MALPGVGAEVLFDLMQSRPTDNECACPQAGDGVLCFHQLRVLGCCIGLVGTFDQKLHGLLAVLYGAFQECGRLAAWLSRCLSALSNIM